MVRSSATFGFVLSLVFGLYLINSSFNFVSLGFLQSFDKYIFLIAGILLIIGGINFLRANRYSM